MTLLPIVERELRVTARRSAIYRNRCLVPALLLLILLGQYMFIPFLAFPAALGRALYGTVSYLALVICVLDGVRKTADCISEEKREGTLGLLFLTDLKGYDVVLGKLAGASLASIHSLLAMVPILGCALFLGGVTIGEIFRMALALGSLLLFSQAVGLWVSSRSLSASHALAGTIFVLLFLLLTPLYFDTVAALSPAWAFISAPTLGYVVHPMGYWVSLLLAQIVVVFLLACAGLNTHRFREEDGAVEAAAAPAALNAASPPGWKHRAEMLNVTPVLWLAGRKRGPVVLIWCLVSLAATVVAGSQVAGLFFTRSSFRYVSFTFAGACAIVLVTHLILKVLLAAQASRCMAEARRNSTLELLLCTPLKVEDILSGQALALKRTFLKPLLAVMLLEMGLVYWLLYQMIGAPSPGNLAYKNFGDVVIAVEAAFLIFYLLDLQGVAWTGIWFGLCSKNESAATFKTAFYIIVLPMLLLVMPCLGIVLFFIWPIAAYVWARLQLQEHFRSLAGLRLISSGKLTAWMPFHVPNLPENSNPD